jgi:glycosyltransferase involved in cell wall biosynthesis
MANVPFRIALLAPLVSPIRQPFLGGAQALLRDLAVTLTLRGADVTLYAAQGSDAALLPGVRLREIAVKRGGLRPANFSASDGSVSPDAGAAMAEAFSAAYAAIASHAGEHDLIHAHAYDAPAFQLGAAQPLPIVHTLHMPDLHVPVSKVLSSLAPVGALRTRSRPWLVTVSEWCAATYDATCQIDAVIPNGVDVDAIPFGANAEEPRYLLFAGRLAPEKGAADAISIARGAGYPLIIAGGIYDQAYFETQVQPWLSSAPPVVTYFGALPHRRVWELMTGATAALVPSYWEEPFGLAACEAQAAGAPVIAYARGGLRDIVADGTTGALVKPGDIEAAIVSVGAVVGIDRTACRARVQEKFTLSVMAERYESLYAHMLNM